MGYFDSHGRKMVQRPPRVAGAPPFDEAQLRESKGARRDAAAFWVAWGVLLGWILAEVIPLVIGFLSGQPG